MIQSLIDTIKIIQKAVDETGLRVDDKEILIQSCTFLRTPHFLDYLDSKVNRNSNVSKGLNNPLPSLTPLKNDSGDSNKKDSDNSPSLKQIALLKKLGYDGDISKLSKQEARILIKEYFENQKMKGGKNENNN